MLNDPVEFNQLIQHFVFAARCDNSNRGGAAGLRASTNRVIPTAAEHHFGWLPFQPES